MARDLPAALREGIRFLGVGTLATVLTIGLFNLFVHVGPAPLANAPLAGFSIAFLVGTAVSFAGNHKWAFEGRVTRSLPSALVVFGALNAGAMLIPVAVLAVSRYLLGNESIWADNIAANGVGMVLATCFRFWAYRRWVFRQPDVLAVNRRREDLSNAATRPGE